MIGVVLIVIHVKSAHYALAAIGALTLLSAVVSLIRRQREPPSPPPDDR